MNATESALRAIKDRVASSLGQLDEAASDATRKENYRRLTICARDLHRCADELQDLLMRFKPKGS